MAGVLIRYTAEQLTRIKESPLVQKPDGLPNIEQWMESQQDQNNSRRPRVPGARENEQASSVENGTSRPSLMSARFSRGSSAQPEDIVLGPPKFSFASAASNRPAKGSDSQDKRHTSALDDDPPERPNYRDRLFKDRDSDRNRDKLGYTNGRRGQREDEGWTNVKSRRSLGQDESDRPHRLGERDRDRHLRDDDGDAGEPSSRRGMGRSRVDRLEHWGREENHSSKDSEPARGGARSQGWRDRERRDDRDWNKSSRAEEDPEWMDSTTSSKPEKKGGHTQEDFQKWKESMKMKSGATPIDEKPSTSELPPSNDAPSNHHSTLSSSKPATPLADDGNLDKLFSGLWGGKQGAQSAAESDLNASKPQAAVKSKPSRFATFFTPHEEANKQLQEALPPPPPLEANGSNEDKEGFQRILQMLGSSNIAAQPPMPQGKPPSNGVRNALENHMPRPDDRPEVLQLNRHPNLRSREERTAFMESVLAPRPTSSGGKTPLSALGGFPPPGMEPQPEQFRMRPDGGRIAEDIPNQPPSRNGHIHDPVLQAALSGRVSQEPHPQPGLSRDREFLLNLMQQSRGPPPPQMPGPNMPRPPMDATNFPFFADEKGNKVPMPKPNGPPPGMMDDFRAFAENERLRLQGRPEDMRQPDAHMRRPMPFRPPGLPEDANMPPGLQRRNTSENIPGRHPLPTNLGIPQQPMPDWMKASGMPPPQDRIPPPPGFNGPPPGVPQQQQQPQGQPLRQPPGIPHMPFSAGSTPLNHPSMGRGMGMPPGPAMFGNQPGQGPQGPPGLPTPNHNQVPMNPQPHGQSQGHMPPPPLGYFGGPGGPGMGAPPGFPPLPMQGDGPMGMQGRGRQHPPPPPPFDMFAEMGRGMGRAGGGMGQQMPGAGFGMG